MPTLYLDYEETSCGGVPENNGLWASRSETVRMVKLKKLVADRSYLSSWCCEEFEVSDELFALEVLYLVLVTYGDGDTFGHSTGNPHFEGLYATAEEAYGLVKEINAGKYRSYRSYNPWEGYFKCLEDVEVRQLRIWR